MEAVIGRNKLRNCVLCKSVGCGCELCYHLAALRGVAVRINYIPVGIRAHARIAVACFCKLFDKRIEVLACLCTGKELFSSCLLLGEIRIAFLGLDEKMLYSSITFKRFNNLVCRRSELTLAGKELCVKLGVNLLTLHNVIKESFVHACLCHTVKESLSAAGRLDLSILRFFYLSFFLFCKLNALILCIKNNGLKLLYKTVCLLLEHIGTCCSFGKLVVKRILH